VIDHFVKRKKVPKNDDKKKKDGEKEKD